MPGCSGLQGGSDGMDAISASASSRVITERISTPVSTGVITVPLRYRGVR